MADRYEPLRRIKEEIGSRVDNKKWIATGIVEQVRKKDRKVVVSILPELKKTNWLRIYALNANNSYMSSVLPEVGTEVVVLFLGANPNEGIVLMGNVPQKEDAIPDVEGDNDWLIMDKYGNKIHMKQGKVVIESDSIELGEGATNKLVNETFLSLFMQHAHIDPLSGYTGPVDPATTVILDSHKTSVTKAK